jgi:hypothetical protein
MSTELMIEGGAVLGCAVAILAMGNSRKRRDHRIALIWLGLTIVSGGIADSEAMQHDNLGTYLFLAVAACTLVLGAFFAVRAARSSISDIWKGL